MLELSEVSHSYGAIPVLTDISLQISSGEVVGMVGVNGVGKTTLLKIIVGRLKPTSGSVVRDCSDRPGAVIGLFEHGPLRPRLSPRENLRLIQRYLGEGSAAACGPRVERTLDDAAVAVDLRDRPLAALSQGNRQRVRLGASLLSRPELLVVDEPHQGLDHHTLAHMRNVLHDHAAAGAAVVLTTHLLVEVEKGSTRAIELDAGTIRSDLPVSPAPERARFVARPPAGALECFANLGVGVRSVRDCEFVIECAPQAIHRIVEALVAANIAVDECGAWQQSLEDRQAECRTRELEHV